MLVRTRTARLGLFAAAGALALSLALVPAAFAGKGGGGGHKGGGGTSGGSGTISLALPLVMDVNGNGLPNWNDTVTFNISTAATSQPFVNLLCYQSGVSVSDGWRGYFAGSLDTNWNFTLSSGMWPGGAADCTAWLGMYTSQGFQRLASTSFHVYA
jgi:hypothetical protein